MSDLPLPQAICLQCGRAIIETDDDARICVQCGGRNRRKYQETGWLRKQIASARKSMDSWPNWLKKAARWEGGRG